MDMLLHYFAGVGLMESIGVAGFFCYIGSFSAVQFGMMDGNRLPFTLLNILAASLVGISLFAEFNLASALIQGSWIVIGMIGLGLRFFGAFPKRHQSQKKHVAKGGNSQCLT